jgi:hypothetical protein
MAQLRSALLESATPERLKALGDELYRAALGGNCEAAKLWLAYCVGRPAEVVDPDTLDLEEFRLLETNPTAARIIHLAIDGVPAARGSEILSFVLPADLEATKKKLCPKDETSRRSLEQQVAKEQEARIGKGRSAHK